MVANGFVRGASASARARSACLTPSSILRVRLPPRTVGRGQAKRSKVSRRMAADHSRYDAAPRWRGNTVAGVSRTRRVHRAENLGENGPPPSHDAPARRTELPHGTLERRRRRPAPERRRSSFSPRFAVSTRAHFLRRTAPVPRCSNGRTGHAGSQHRAGHATVHEAADIELGAFNNAEIARADGETVRSSEGGWG